MTDLLPALVALFTALAGSFFIEYTKRWHGSLSFDSDTGVQRQHQQPTPRVGGLAIWLGLLMGVMVCADELCASVWLVGSPVFIVGLIEDLSKTVSVGTRLMASMLAGVIGWWLTGYSLNHLHWPGVDAVLLSAPVLAVALSCFAVAGITNAINIVDGFNGIAAGSVLVGASAFYYLAYVAGDTELMTACSVLIGALAGFLLLNWPRGKLFLGDGGAYLAGSSLGWLAVMINARIPEVSAWALLLICAYPVQEVLFTIWRRRRRQKHWGHPDRLHLHSLVGRRLIKPLMPRSSALARNSATGLVMLMANALPVAWALTWPGEDLMLVLGFAVCAWVYRLFYQRLTRFSWRPSAPTELIAQQVASR